MSDNKEFQIQQLSSALSVSGQTIQTLEKRISDAQQIIFIMEQEKKQWQQQKVLQDRIIKQQLVAADADKSRLQDEILELRAKLKEAA
jgi:hypothetical protein